MKRKEPQPCAHLSPDGAVCNLVTAHLRPGEKAPCVFPDFKIRGGGHNMRSPRTGTTSCPIILLDTSLNENYPKGLTGGASIHRGKMIRELPYVSGIGSDIRSKLDR